MVDSDRIRDRLTRLDRLLGTLEAVLAQGRESYVRDLDTRLKAERALQLAIQICIDIGAHLIAELGLDQPSDYRGVFRSLEAADVIDDRLARRLADAAGLRNLLVHGYADLNDTTVWEALQRLDDLRDFAAATATRAGL